uniref:Uncharacterized protein n=1 Tax=Syphacia muris TaxID=451379 RepID=A0A0N5AZS7_9BILA
MFPLKGSEKITLRRSTSWRMYKTQHYEVIAKLSENSFSTLNYVAQEWYVVTPPYGDMRGLDVYLKHG